MLSDMQGEKRMKKMKDPFKGTDLDREKLLKDSKKVEKYYTDHLYFRTSLAVASIRMLDCDKSKDIEKIMGHLFVQPTQRATGIFLKKELLEKNIKAKMRAYKTIDSIKEMLESSVPKRKKKVAKKKVGGRRVISLTGSKK